MSSCRRVSNAGLEVHEDVCGQLADEMTQVTFSLSPTGKPASTHRLQHTLLSERSLVCSGTIQCIFLEHRVRSCYARHFEENMVTRRAL